MNPVPSRDKRGLRHRELNPGPLRDRRELNPAPLRDRLEYQLAKRGHQTGKGCLAGRGTPGGALGEGRLAVRKPRFGRCAVPTGAGGVADATKAPNGGGSSLGTAWATRPEFHEISA